MGDHFYEAANATFDKVTAMPGMGAPRYFASACLEGLRMIPVLGFERHLVFYRPIETGVEIVRVLYSARDIESLFNE
jgi:toxin ParE1/3/4